MNSLSISPVKVNKNHSNIYNKTSKHSDFSFTGNKEKKDDKKKSGFLLGLTKTVLTLGGIAALVAFAIPAIKKHKFGDVKDVEKIIPNTGNLSFPDKFKRGFIKLANTIEEKKDDCSKMLIPYRKFVSDNLFGFMDNKHS